MTCMRSIRGGVVEDDRRVRAVEWRDDRNAPAYDRAMELEKARDALRDGAVDVALTHVRNAWRARRHPELADVIDSMGRRIHRPPVPGRTLKERHSAWLALAGSGDAADVPRLVAMLLEGTSATDIQARVEALAAAGPDPRLAAALAEVIKAQRHFTTKPRFWSAVLKAIDDAGDSRQVVSLRSARPRGVVPQHRTGYNGVLLFDLKERLAERLPRIADKLEKLTPAELPSAERRILDEIMQLCAPAGAEADLLAAVLAAPADDAPRLVLADVLVERGDPHGELIQLQIKRARGEGGRPELRREKELIKAHRQAILGPIAPCVTGEVIERGFLARCATNISAAHEELIAHRLWATVESLETSDSRLVAQPHVRPRELVLVGVGCARDVLGGELVRSSVTSLGLRVFVAHAAETLALVTPKVFPNLRRLGLIRFEGRRGPGVASVMSGALAPRLEELFVRSDEDVSLELEAWRETAQRVRVRFELPWVEATFDGETLRVERFRSHDHLNTMLQRESESGWRPRVVKPI
jgi:uncharacterized protein (TIGR02996 family)